MKVDIIFFQEFFYIFLKFSLFCTDFFFASTGETFFVNPASGTMDITSPKDFPSRSIHTESNSLFITDPTFSTSFFVGLKIFFPESSLAQLFTSVNASLLLATQPVFFLKRLLSTGVVKRQHLHSSTWCRVFLPWEIFCQLSTEYAFRYCCFFSGGDHCEIWLSMALRKRPINENVNFFVIVLHFSTCKYLATFKRFMERNTYFCSHVNEDILRNVPYRADISLPVAGFSTPFLIHCRFLKFFSGKGLSIP